MAIDYIQDDEPVDAAITNRPIQQLARQVSQLSRDVAAITNRKACIDERRPITPHALVGSPVAYNATEQRYVLAVHTYDSSSPTLLTSTANVRGVVSAKPYAQVADVAVSGVISLTEAQAAAVGITAAGVYKLSSTAGQYTTTGTGQDIGYWDGVSRFHLLIRPVDVAAAHHHYTFDLSFSHVESGNGWLNVGDTQLPPGTIPEGAVYGYNRYAHTALNAAWPPSPAEQASLTLFIGGWDGYGQELPAGLYQITDSTIWWMTNASGHRPWELVGAQNGSSAVPTSSLDLRESPDPRLVLSFSKVKYATTPSTVTRLVSADPNGPVKIKRCDGTPGSDGPLQVVVDFDTSSTTLTEAGHVVVKSLTPAGRSVRGPVVEGVYTDDDSVTLSSNDTVAITVDDVTRTMHRGRILLRANQEPPSRTLTPLLIHLVNATQRPDLLTVGMPEGMDSSVILKFVMNGSGRFPQSAEATPVFWFSGGADAVLPDFTVSYRRISDPGTSVVTVPTANTTLSLVTTPVPTVDEGEYAEMVWEAFPVSADDVVIVTISRAGSTDSYAGEVGILNMALVVAAS